jgi:hypothetical protein
MAKYSLCRCWIGGDRFEVVVGEVGRIRWLIIVVRLDGVCKNEARLSKNF